MTVTPTLAAANKPYDGTTARRVTSCTLSGLVGDGCRQLHAQRGELRQRGGRHRQDGDGERPDADGRGGRQLHAAVDHGDDDGDDHRADGDAGAGRGEQGLRRHDGATRHELHAERPGRRRMSSSCTRSAASFDTPAVGTGKTVTVTGLTLSGAGGRQLRARRDDGDDDGGHHGGDADPGGGRGEQGVRRHDRRHASPSCTLSGAGRRATSSAARTARRPSTRAASARARR